MTRHLVRLIWNRKRQNFLLAVEIFFSFLVLFAVVLLAANYMNNWRQPLGYSIDRVWSIGVDRKERDTDPAVKARHLETFRQLFATLRDLPGVELAAGVNVAPYSNFSWGQNADLLSGRRVQYRANSATGEFRDLMDLKIVEGRWFSADDESATARAVIINRLLATEIFGDANAIGQLIPEKQEANENGELPEAKRVVGVIEDFRKDGELSTAEPFLFYRMRVDVPGADMDSSTLRGGRTSSAMTEVPNVVLIRVAPGTTATFEETLIARLQSVARDWSFDIRPLEVAREDKLKAYTLPLVVAGTVATFLLLMVALGLTGVVWQGVTQRTREFGVRRAKGATAVNVRRQVLMELAIMTSLALIPGVALVVQVALLRLDPDIWIFPRSVFVGSIALSVTAIYLLTLACGWYPSRLATRIQPAEALHYE